MIQIDLSEFRNTVDNFDLLAILDSVRLSELIVTGPGPRRYHIVSRNLFLRENQIEAHIDNSSLRLL